MSDFFLVGAPKAGTTSLYEYLKQHPNIAVPLVKEPNYYIEVGPQKRNIVDIKTEKEYTKLYKDAKPNQLKGDFSVSYLHGKDTPKLIHQDNPSAKIIIIVRNPVKRAFSHWLMDTREGFTKADFIEAFTNDYEYKDKRGFCFNSMYYDCGLYADAIEKYQSYFDNVLILIYEDLFKDIGKQMNQIYDFLEVSKIELEEYTKSNASGIVKNNFFARIYHSVIIRKILKTLLPKGIKDKLRSMVMTKNNRKITKEEYEYIYPFFEKDLNRVRALLNKKDLWKPKQ